MGESVNSPYLENGKLLLNCREGLIQGNIYYHLYFCCIFFPILGYLFRNFCNGYLQNSQVDNVHVVKEQC